jgi:hypothetical protein
MMRRMLADQDARRIELIREQGCDPKVPRRVWGTAPSMQGAMRFVYCYWMTEDPSGVQHLLGDRLGDLRNRLVGQRRSSSKAP